MKKLVKIAEIDAESAESAQKVAEALARCGFQIVVHEDVCYQNRFDILEITQ